MLGLLCGYLKVKNKPATPSLLMRSLHYSVRRGSDLHMSFYFSSLGFNWAVGKHNWHFSSYFYPLTI